MPTNNIIEEATTLGEILRHQIEAYRGTATPISQADIAAEVGIHQGTLSRIQNDRADTVYRLRPDQVLTLLRGYRLSDQEVMRVAERFNLQLPLQFTIYMQKQENDLLQRELSRRLVDVRHFGIVNAGMSNVEHGEETGMRAILADYLDGSDPDNCFLLEVSGDSMTCEDVRKSIPPGSTLIVDPTLRPENGDVVVCELEIQGDRTGVVKIYRPIGRGVVLDSFNAEHPPVLLTEDMEVVMRGVVINWIPPGRRSLRKHFWGSGR